VSKGTPSFRVFRFEQLPLSRVNPLSGSRRDCRLVFQILQPVSTEDETPVVSVSDLQSRPSSVPETGVSESGPDLEIVKRIGPVLRNFRIRHHFFHRLRSINWNFTLTELSAAADEKVVS
jgi:hypothetical protein